MSLKNASLGLKITPTLKNEITNLAKNENKSVNIWVTEIIEKHIKSIYSEKESADIPKAAELHKHIAEQQLHFYKEALGIVKSKIKTMIHKGKLYFFIHDSEIPPAVRDDVIKHLDELGYYIYKVKAPFSIMTGDEDGIRKTQYLANDIIASHLEEQINFFAEYEADQKESPS